MKNLLIFLCVIVLGACGGSSSSSGGGTDNGVPGPTKYAGTYKGNLITSGSFDGEVGSASQAVTLTIAENGRVTMNAGPADGTACVNTPPPAYINGSVIPFNGSGTCFVPNVGTCDLEFEGSIQMAGNSGVGKAEGKIRCGSSSGDFTYDIGVNKT